MSVRPLFVPALLACLFGCEAGGEPDAPAAAGPAALLERGKALMGRGDPAAAEAAFAAALTSLEAAGGTGPAVAEAYLERGIARERQGRDADAEADYTAALAADPPDNLAARAANNRAAVRARAGRMTEALEDWDRSLTLTPGDALAVRNRALGRQAVGNYDGALEDAAALEQLRPGDYEPALRTGAVLLAAGRPGEALAPLGEAVKRAAELPPQAAGPAAAAAHRERAAALRALGRPAEAAAAFEEAVAADPALADSPEAGLYAAVAAVAAELESWGLTLAATAPPAGFDLLAEPTGGGGPVRPVLVAEPGPGGGYFVSADELAALARTPTALLAVPVQGGGDGGPRVTVTLHEAASVARSDPRPVRFLVPGPDAAGR